MALFFKKKSGDIKTSQTTNQNSNANPLSDKKKFENTSVINEANNGDLQLLKEIYNQNKNNQIFLINKSSNICISKEYPSLPGQSKSVWSSAISNYGFAVVIDTYFDQNPHMVLDLYLYNNLGDELFHIYYSEKGYRKFTFSESGQYFILAETMKIYIYDMELQKISIFSPEDMDKSDFRDFIIFEKEQRIAFCYTHHPDKPFYHFTFSGRLIEENAFRAQVNKMSELDAETKRYFAFLEEIDNAQKPISDEDYKKFIQELQSYSVKPKFQDSAWLYRRMGELELDASNKQNALEYFAKALSLDPNIGVKRIFTKLSKELKTIE